MQRVEVDRALHVIRREPREVLKHKRTAKPGRCPRACVCSCVRVRACVRVCMGMRACACARACVRACMYARACVCACVRACVRVCALQHAALCCTAVATPCTVPRVTVAQYRSGTLRRYAHRRRDWAVLAGTERTEPDWRVLTCVLTYPPTSRIARMCPRASRYAVFHALHTPPLCCHPPIHTAAN